MKPKDSKGFFDQGANAEHSFHSDAHPSLGMDPSAPCPCLCGEDAVRGWPESLRLLNVEQREQIHVPPLCEPGQPRRWRWQRAGAAGCGSGAGTRPGCAGAAAPAPHGGGFGWGGGGPHHCEKPRMAQGCRRRAVPSCPPRALPGAPLCAPLSRSCASTV